MKIGIDASRAFVAERTGIEEYSYQMIKNLSREIPGEQVVLYVRKGQRPDFSLPEKWLIKEINLPFLWTQLGLSLELLLHPVGALFVPAHVVPLFHPKKTIVTIHGLEYEFCPESYSFWERFYMRASIKASCLWAEKIVTVSENTRKDLVDHYQVPAGKITVVAEGYEKKDSPEEAIVGNVLAKYGLEKNRYLLFIGRLEERKNVSGIIEAFGILKEKYQLPYRLVLAGKPGYGYENAKCKIKNANFENDIILTGFVSEAEKADLLKNAAAFLFPSFYEGFGLPVLEAQAAGVPVITSRTASLPEVAGEGAVLVDPSDPGAIAEGVWKVIQDGGTRNAMISKGRANLFRFGWGRAARKIAPIIIEEKS